jgi:cyclophilin family peptidyl-prolyl cis-trans isomerase
MANSGPNTNGSQFFIVTGKVGESLPANYSLFGQVISGQKVVATIGGGVPGSSGSPEVVQRMLGIIITNSAN